MFTILYIVNFFFGSILFFHENFFSYLRVSFLIKILSSFLFSFFFICRFLKLKGVSLTRQKYEKILYKSTKNRTFFYFSYNTLIVIAIFFQLHLIFTFF